MTEICPQQPAPLSIDALHGAVQLVWYEVLDAVPHVHALGWVELTPGEFRYFYRCMSPFADEAEVIDAPGPQPGIGDNLGPFMNALVILNNRRSVEGRRRLFDQLPFHVVGFNHVEESLLALWRATQHFTTEDILERRRRFDAYRALWMTRGEPPPAEPDGVERLHLNATSVADRRSANWIATIHWWNRSRRDEYRVATFVAIASTWDLLERQGNAFVTRARVERFLSAYGMSAFDRGGPRLIRS